MATVLCIPHREWCWCLSEVTTERPPFRATGSITKLRRLNAHVTPPEDYLSRPRSNRVLRLPFAASSLESGVGLRAQRSVRRPVVGTTD